METKSTRELALDSLNHILGDEGYSNIEINHTLEDFELSESNQRLYTKLVYGVIQNQIYLNSILTPYITGKIIRPGIKNIFLMAIYQLCFLDRIPQYAIADEAVELSKRNGNIPMSKFVNAIIQNIIRDINDGKLSLNKFSSDELQQMDTKKLGVVLSIPQWILEKTIKQFGKNEAIRIMQSFNEEQLVEARVNTGKIDIDGLQDELRKMNIMTTRSEDVENSIVFENGSDAVDNQLFRKGYYLIQNKSATLVGQSILVGKEENILDICAAPGGKTTHLAEKGLHLGTKVVANDIYPHKINLIKENAKKLGLTNITTNLADATEYSSDFPYDQILADVPCSGMGLIGRKPEIRYQRKPQDIKRLQKLQGKILKNSARSLKSGGTLTYSTCTIFDEENQQVIDRFLEKHSDFKQIKTPNIPEKYLTSSGGALILPTHENDGFFVATLRKD